MKLQLTHITYSDSTGRCQVYKDTITKYVLQKDKINSIDDNFATVGQNIDDVVDDFYALATYIKRAIGLGTVSARQFRMDISTSGSSSMRPNQWTDDEISDSTLLADNVLIYDFDVHGGYGNRLALYTIKGLTAYIDADIDKEMDIYLEYDPYTKLITNISATKPTTGLDYAHLVMKLNITKPTAYPVYDSANHFKVTTNGSIYLRTGVDQGIPIVDASDQPVDYPNSFNDPMVDSQISFDFYCYRYGRLEVVPEVYSRV